jgi:hypothetical protein
MPEGLAIALGVSATGDHRDDFGGGLEFSVGLRRLHSPSEQTVVDTSAGMGALCAPILCGFVGIAAVPKSAVIGDEIGLDLRARVRHGGAGTTMELGLRPIGRASPRGSWRTASFLGALLPELAVTFGDPTAASLWWYPYPLERLVGSHSRLTLDIGVGVQTTISDGAVDSRAVFRASLGFTRMI